MRKFIVIINSLHKSWSAYYYFLVSFDIGDVGMNFITFVKKKKLYTKSSEKREKSEKKNVYCDFWGGKLFLVGEKTKKIPIANETKVKCAFQRIARFFIQFCDDLFVTSCYLFVHVRF